MADTTMMKYWLSNLPIVGRLFASQPKPALSLESPEAVVAYYQAFGLLADRKPDEVVDEYQNETGWELDPSKPWDDLMLLSEDRSHVWRDDPEADVCSENQVYVELLQEWSSISSGCFRPERIRETWSTEEGPVDIRFLQDGVPHSLEPEYWDDWVDLRILGGINRRRVWHSCL